MKHLILSALIVTMACSAPAFGDVKVKATLCNHSKGPVDFELYNHNDLAKGAEPLMTKAVRACSCVEKQTHTDLWENQPPANIIQLVYRDVGSAKSTNVKVCIDAEGEFEGYVDVTANTCVEAKEKVSYLPAPELTRAQGDLKKLETGMMPKKAECTEKATTGFKPCLVYAAHYEYTDGERCSGNK